MTDKETIINSVLEILDSIEVVSDKLKNLLDDYRSSGKTSVLGNEIENVEIIDIPKITDSMNDLVYQIEEAGIED